MFGPRLNTIFASRWKALWWALGVLLTAYCTIPSADNAPGTGKGESARHVNPWAKGYKPAEAAPPKKGAVEELKEAIAAAKQPAPEEHVNPWAAKSPEPQQSGN